MSAGKLPEGWSQIVLGDVVEVNSGVGFPEKYQGKNAGDYPVYKVRDISVAVLEKKGFLNSAGHYVTENEAFELKGKIFRSGSTLFAKIGEAVKLNRRAYVRTAGLADNNVMAVSSILEDMDKFIYYILNTVDLTETSRSTTVPSIRKGDIENITLSLPPLAEQKIIAEKLDTLLAQVDSTKARLEQIPKILKRFRQAILVAAVNGKLSSESRRLQKYTIGSLCVSSFDGPFGSKLKTSDYTISGVRVVRLENIGHLEFKNDKKTFISSDKYEELQSNTLCENDLLFSSFVDEDVRVCLVPKSNETFINKADCFCLRTNPDLVSPHYLAFILASKASYDQIKNKVQGITRPRINLGTLRSLEFELPPLPEQHEIVRRVEQLFTYADTIEKQVNSALARVNNLTQSILAKAFRGELTAQWRAENPDLISGENSAEALLEKIKAERAASTGKKASRKKA
ncbi:restriction endonuclease subunit S [Kosakonia sp. MH5]|uniref:restriction endonuclease subunit S n=1 Tax=Kosakonia sp. MH5 TaxID=2202822 RepID=UPI001374C7AC|nr:restriction endonuclease subunit S [Kosakonia sp. MH5]NCF06901.1 type I restriction endonuclease subunit S [Kosakonia sp. MH5]